MFKTLLKWGASIILDSLDPHLRGGGGGVAVKAGKRERANRVVNPSRFAPERLFLSSLFNHLLFSLSLSLCLCFSFSFSHFSLSII